MTGDIETRDTERQAVRSETGVARSTGFRANHGLCLRSMSVHVKIVTLVSNKEKYL